MKLGIAESFMCSPARHQAEVGGFPRLRLLPLINFWYDAEVFYRPFLHVRIVEEVRADMAFK